jgi:hypothetical protein
MVSWFLQANGKILNPADQSTIGSRITPPSTLLQDIYDQFFEEI